MGNLMHGSNGATFRCTGDNDLPDVVFQFTDIVVQLHEHFYHMAQVTALKIQEDTDDLSFPRPNCLPAFNAFLPTDFTYV